MKKWFMIPVMLLFQKPYQECAMSLNTHDKYILGDIEPMAFSIWRKDPDILFDWEGNSSCRAGATVVRMINVVKTGCCW